MIKSGSVTRLRVLEECAPLDLARANVDPEQGVVGKKRLDKRGSQVGLCCIRLKDLELHLEVRRGGEGNEGITNVGVSDAVLENKESSWKEGGGGKRAKHRLRLNCGAVGHCGERNCSRARPCNRANSDQALGARKGANIAVCHSAAAGAR
jgi:hypothetical protein